jgi:3-dehydroquinate synthase
MSICVDLDDRSYPIFIDSSCLLKHADALQAICHGKKVAVVSNETIAPLYLASISQALGHQPDATVLLPDGEQFKTLEYLDHIFSDLLEAKLNRSSVLIALGGGVVGDMTGFAAACYQRGIDFIQVPTTLLSQVDSSVGGKTAVNHPLGKNMIGAFYQPKAVFIDIDSLNTLPAREVSAGMAEVIKYGLIYDEKFFIWLEENVEALMSKQADALRYAIERSCQIKSEVVAQDEKEGGIRAILNLGHTFGHAIESNEGYGNWLHGEAVSVGMVMAVNMSVELGYINEDVATRTVNLLKKAHLPIYAPAGSTVEGFIRVMSGDKKNIHGNIRLVLLKSLGRAFICDDYPDVVMKSVITANIAA